MVQALDPETGRSLWSVQIGNSSYPSVPVAANSQYVAAVNGSTLYLLKRSGRGHSIAEIHVRFPQHRRRDFRRSCLRADVQRGLGLLQARPYVPSTGRCCCSTARGLRLPPPLVSATHLMWGTDRGHVYIDGLANSENRIRFHVNGPVTAGLAYEPPLVFAGSEIITPTALDETTGNKAWDFYAGSPIRHPPVAINEAVYVIPDAGGMTRLTASTESRMVRSWRPPIRGRQHEPDCTSPTCQARCLSWMPRRELAWPCCPPSG